MENELAKTSIEGRKNLKVRFLIRNTLAGIIRKLRMTVWRMRGYDIHPSTILERNLNLDRLYPQGIHIGEGCMIASGTTILSHDHCKRTGPGALDTLLKDTYIGNNCFLAVNCMILPGVHIGNECVVGAGAVVTKDVPAHSVVAGNPARIIRSGIRMGNGGVLLNWNPSNGWTV